MTLDKRVVNDMKITNNDMLNIFKRKSQILNSVRNPSINEVSYIFFIDFYHLHRVKEFRDSNNQVLREIITFK